LILCHHLNLDVRMSCLQLKGSGNLHANEAVTKTEAKPPMPPTKGALGMYQLWAPM
jgi:hypothetical protein